MNRDEAQQAVGQSVTVWTAANGCYVGTLTAVLVTKGRPWRGQVTITGVLSAAQHFEGHALMRRGFRPGEPIEAGGTNIALAQPTEVGTDYLTVLTRLQAQSQARLAQDPHHPYAWATHGTMLAAERAMAAETARLAGEPWVLSGHLPAYRAPVATSPTGA
jgi:hypothetical protein